MILDILMLSNFKFRMMVFSRRFQMWRTQGCKLGKLLYIVHNAEFNVETSGVFWYEVSLPAISDAPTLEIGWEIPPSVVALELEQQGAFQPSDYPAGPLVFENFDPINIRMTNNLNTPPISRKTSVDSNPNVEVKVEVDGAENGRVSIVFPTD
ncbi:hypothetical protein MIND_01059700 [Mycena indigotica]|uniref:Uncharacterized protein n=1 Tax=Mycena indigotica TaxID=2126181 RepID=A0A8H6W0T0_9AGAR|nr:uncharacterized protein MIND_01059700 [Mycena indigotica]KAF7295209.1 hypothetical protein MIND_01059700 [Mycena indigotica]